MSGRNNRRKGKTEFAYYTFTPRPLTKGNFFEADNELTDILSTTYHTLGILEGMVKYAPSRESFTEISLLMECCYSRLIDYNDPSLYSALSGESIDCVADIASAYKYSNGKAITPSLFSDLCKIALHGIESDEKMSIRNKQIFMLNGVSNLKVYNSTAPDEILPSLADISSYLSSTELADAFWYCNLNLMVLGSGSSLFLLKMNSWACSHYANGISFWPLFSHFASLASRILLRVCVVATSLNG